MHHITQLGIAFQRGRELSFGIKAHDRLHHMFVLGQTGTGKSSLLRSMTLQDAANNQGFCLIDPHGDIAKDLHQTIGREHIYWDLADPSCPYGYNPVPRIDRTLRPLIAAGFVDTLKHQWPDAWGPRIENLLRWGMLALLDQSEASILDLMPLYTDKEYRRQIIANIEDEECKRFWQVDYPNMAYQTMNQGVAAVANKLGPLIANPIIRSALTTPTIPLKFRQIIDQGSILIVNLGKGQLGSEVSNVLGGLILSGLRNAAFTRQDTPEHLRRPYFVSVDEFHNFTSETIAESLSELRKYGLSLTLAGQHLAQTSPATQAAILGNVGTSIAFRLGIKDAPLMNRYLGFPSEADLLNQPNHHAYCRLMIDGCQSNAFTMKTLPP